MVDVTPPIGDHLCGGCLPTSIGIETPLYLRGLILSANGTRYVLAAIDYCVLRGRSQDRFVQALAEAAGVEPEHATLHSTHVHDAPLIDEETHALIEGQTPPLHNEKFFEVVLRNSRAAIESTLKTIGAPVGGVAFTRHRVEKFASARRVLDEKGHCLTRWSVCLDDELRAAPEGRIDPMLDQVVLHGEGNEPLVCLSFYASHPQVADRRRLVSSDCVGVALELFERTNPGVFPIYFTGCAGDVTAGKYTSSNRDRNRLDFGLRLFDAMQSAFLKAAPRPLEKVGWRDRVKNVPLRAIPESESHFASAIDDREVPLPEKYTAALKLHRLRANIDTYPFRISRLDLNDIKILFLPAEMMVDYQLYAKSQAGCPLAIAAYGGSSLIYVPTDEMYSQGGYEVDPRVSEIAPGSEALVKRAIDLVLCDTAQELKSNG